MTADEKALAALRRWGEIRRLIAEVHDESEREVDEASAAGDMARVKRLTNGPLRACWQALADAERLAGIAAGEAADAMVAEGRAR